jgi:hypothetical protein
MTNVTKQLSLAIAATAFDEWASSRGYDLAPAVLPAPDRMYADRQTQEAFDVWNAAVARVARVFGNSTIETDAFISRLRGLADDAPRR